MAMHYKYSSHAEFQIKERDISKKTIHNVLQKPGQIIKGKHNRFVLQSILRSKGQDQLIRVICQNYPEDTVVITAYITTKISKYWENRL